MTRDQAIQKALQYVETASLSFGGVLTARHLDLADLEHRAKDCPPELLPTYESVRKTFRSHWVVAFQLPERSGQVTCPSTGMICVYDDGEVLPYPSL
jgi:hypothetical protein